MDRRDRILSGLDLAALTGVEIGALDRPLVRQTDGQVLYVDHTDRPTLRGKYADDPNIVADNLVEVDAIWGDKTLLDAVGRTVDYVVASHVIEHVPDLITWLAEVRDVLAAGGQLRLAVPDRRFTFDYYRSETRLSDVVHAWFVRARRPLPHSILDFCLEAAEIDLFQAWRGQVKDAKPMSDFQRALEQATDARDNGAYHDVHCWVFTPASFVRLMDRLVELGLVGFSCRAFFTSEPNTIEFIVHAERCDDAALSAASWKAVLARIDPQNRDDQGADIAALRQTIASLSAELEAIRNSIVWKFVRPLWPIMRRLRGAWRTCRGALGYRILR